jgi:hypothetical protein
MAYDMALGVGPDSAKGRRVHNVCYAGAPGGDEAVVIYSALPGPAAWNMWDEYGALVASGASGTAWTPVTVGGTQFYKLQVGLAGQGVLRPGWYVFQRVSSQADATYGTQGGTCFVTIWQYDARLPVDPYRVDNPPNGTSSLLDWIMQGIMGGHGVRLSMDVVRSERRNGTTKFQASGTSVSATQPGEGTYGITSESYFVFAHSFVGTGGPGARTVTVNGSTPSNLEKLVEQTNGNVTVTAWRTWGPHPLNSVVTVNTANSGQHSLIIAEESWLEHAALRDPVQVFSGTGNPDYLIDGDYEAGDADARIHMWTSVVAFDKSGGVANVTGGAGNNVTWNRFAVDGSGNLTTLMTEDILAGNQSRRVVASGVPAGTPWVAVAFLQATQDIITGDKAGRINDHGVLKDWVIDYEHPDDPVAVTWAFGGGTEGFEPLVEAAVKEIDALGLARLPRYHWEGRNEPNTSTPPRWFVATEGGPAADAIYHALDSSYDHSNPATHGIRQLAKFDGPGTVNINKSNVGLSFVLNKMDTEGMIQRGIHPNTHTYNHYTDPINCIQLNRDIKREFAARGVDYSELRDTEGGVNTWWGEGLLMALARQQVTFGRMAALVQLGVSPNLQHLYYDKKGGHDDFLGYHFGNHGLYLSAAAYRGIRVELSGRELLREYDPGPIYRDLMVVGEFGSRPGYTNGKGSSFDEDPTGRVAWQGVSDGLGELTFALSGPLVAQLAVRDEFGREQSYPVSGRRVTVPVMREQRFMVLPAGVRAHLVRKQVGTETITASDELQFAHSTDPQATYTEMRSLLTRDILSGYSVSGAWPSSSDTFVTRGANPEDGRGGSVVLPMDLSVLVPRAFHCDSVLFVSGLLWQSNGGPIKYDLQVRNASDGQWETVHSVDYSDPAASGLTGGGTGSDLDVWPYGDNGAKRVVLSVQHLAVHAEFPGRDITGLRVHVVDASRGMWSGALSKAKSTGPLTPNIRRVVAYSRRAADRLAIG